MPEFIKWPSIERLHKRPDGCCITEKIDGSNGQIVIIKDEVGLKMYVGSRNRWLVGGNPVATLVGGVITTVNHINKDQDNYGFANWVKNNAAELFKLGEGHHYGEWYGSGIQRGYGMVNGEKHFAIFNTSRPFETLPECVQQVPVLYTGKYSKEAINITLELLQKGGSILVPGFMKPEGIVVYIFSERKPYKITFENDKGKWSANNV